MASRRKGRPVRRLELDAAQQSEDADTSSQLNSELGSLEDNLSICNDPSLEDENCKTEDEKPPEGDVGHSSKKRLQNESVRSRTFKEFEDGTILNAKRRRTNGSVDVSEDASGIFFSKVLASKKKLQQEENSTKALQPVYSVPPEVAALIAASKGVKPDISLKELFRNAAKDSKPTSPPDPFDEPSLNRVKPRNKTAVSPTNKRGVSRILMKRGTIDIFQFDEKQCDQYIAKYDFKNPCKIASCTHPSKEHYHCTDSNCDFPRFTSKVAVIGHYNKHKKSENALTHGFMRITMNEDCTDRFKHCSYNGSTHYHCLHTNCKKVCTFSSEVIRHDNMHRRDANILPIGFEQYTPLQSCNDESCQYSKRSTSHIHCTREDCRFTCVNIADTYRHCSDHLRLNSSKLKKATKSESSLNFFQELTPQRDDGISSQTSSPFEGAIVDMTNQKPTRNGFHGDGKDDHVTDQSPNNQSEDGLTSSTASLENEFKISKKTAQLLPSTTTKYFERYSKYECPVSDCVFNHKFHYHCVIQNCCAVFTELQFVLSHTLFHENLDKLGITQNRSNFFHSYSLKDDFSCQPSTSTPPAGFVTLSRLINSTKRIKSIPQTLSDRDPPNLTSDPFQSLKKNYTFKAIAPKPIQGKDSFNSQTDQGHVKKKSPTFKAYEPKPEKNRPSLSSFAKQKSQIRVEVTQSLPTLVAARKKSVPSMVKHKASTLSLSGITSTKEYLHAEKGEACIREDCKYLGQSHWHCMLTRCRYVCKSLAKAQSHLQTHDSLETYAKAAKDFFECYTVKKPCPYPNCEFRLRGHYHCVKPGCRFVTFGTSKLPWHVKKHEKIANREASGFKYFTKSDRCQFHDCKYSGCYSHYHCVRPGCTYAFQYKHQLSTHVRKHMRRDMARSNLIGYSTTFSMLNNSNTDASTSLADGEDVGMEQSDLDVDYEGVDFNDGAMATDNENEEDSGELLDESNSPDCHNGSSSDLVLNMSASHADSDSDGA